MDEVKYLQLARNLSAFREKLQVCAKTLDVRERQQILRLLVKEILVDTQSITIRRSIPIPRQKKVLLREDRQRPNSFPWFSATKLSFASEE
jgi:hypothetical protein